MRTIKFRGKSKLNSEWVYGDLVQCMSDDIKIVNSNRPKDLSYKIIDIQNETIGQFTGLRDMNGKEIYEGDILKVYYYGKSKVFGFVRFGRSRFFIDDDFLRNELEAKAPMTELFSHYSFEVVGNIHDNPELLKNND